MVLTVTQKVFIIKGIILEFMIMRNHAKVSRNVQNCVDYMYIFKCVSLNANVRISTG